MLDCFFLISATWLDFYQPIYDQNYNLFGQFINMLQHTPPWPLEMPMLTGALRDIWRIFVFPGQLAKEPAFIFSSFPNIHMQTSPDLITCNLKCTVSCFHPKVNTQNNKLLFRAHSETSSAVSRWLSSNKPLIHCGFMQLSCFYLSQRYRPLIKQMYKEAQLLNCCACSVDWDSQIQQKEFYPARDEYISLLLFLTKGSRYKWPTICVTEKWRAICFY